MKKINISEFRFVEAMTAAAFIKTSAVLKLSAADGANKYVHALNPFKFIFRPQNRANEIAHIITAFREIYKSEKIFLGLFILSNNVKFD